jgi:hypothetical protein
MVSFLSVLLQDKNKIRNMTDAMLKIILATFPPQYL